MTLPALLERLRLPVIGAPLFIVSNPELVIAQCKAGIVGSFPALNARPQPLLDEWLHRITEELAAWDKAIRTLPPLLSRSTRSSIAPTTGCKRIWRPAPNGRCRSSSPHWGAVEEVNQAVHGWGGITLHDVIDDRFARKALRKARTADRSGCGRRGACGAALALRLVQEIREWFRGPLILSGAIATGRAVLAAQAWARICLYRISFHCD
jgi:nitronate monooxygenase